MNAETLEAVIRNDLFIARKERDVVKSQALLVLVSAIDNASAVDMPTVSNATEVVRHVVSIDELREIIKNEINEMQEASAMYKDNNSQLTQELEAKIAVLKNYL